MVDKEFLTLVNFSAWAMSVVTSHFKRMEEPKPIGGFFLLDRVVSIPVAQRLVRLT